MLAKRLVGILRPLTFREAIETTKVHSIAGRLAADKGLLSRRPFHAPHHNISDAGLIDGGLGSLRPGEVSLGRTGYCSRRISRIPTQYSGAFAAASGGSDGDHRAVEYDIVFPGELHSDCRDEPLPV